MRILTSCLLFFEVWAKDQKLAKALHAQSGGHQCPPKHLLLYQWPNCHHRHCFSFFFSPRRHSLVNHDNLPPCLHGSGLVPGNQSRTAALANVWEKRRYTDFHLLHHLVGSLWGSEIFTVSQQDWAPVITSLIMKPFYCLHSLLCLTPHFFPEIASQINYLPLNLCLGVCFCEYSN